MGRFFRKMFSSLSGFLIGVHVLGMGLSFLVFSYQYVRQHSFMEWLVLGEVVPALKAAVWEVFLVLALIQGPPQDLPAPSVTRDSWWRPEYPILIQAVDNATDRLLSTSYRSGPEGKREVRLSLTTTTETVVLRTEIPPESVVTVDPETGETTPSAMLNVLTIRDHNADGTPDDFYMEIGGEPMLIDPSYNEEFTDDGFVKFRRTSPEHQFIMAKWEIGIAFCVNHFLHDVDSVLPSTSTSGNGFPEEERTGYWWNEQTDPGKLSYVAGFSDGFRYWSDLLSLYIVGIELDFEELSSMDRGQLAELNALWAERAHEFAQTKLSIEAVRKEELKHDLDEYFTVVPNKELEVADAISILRIQPFVVPDWMLDHRINELNSESDERYEYLKKRYLEERERRQRQ